MPSLLDRPDVSPAATMSPLQRPFDTRHLDAEFRQDVSFPRRAWNAITHAVRGITSDWNGVRSTTLTYTIYGLEMRPSTPSRCCSDEPRAW